jgi:protein-S-isoprenylcysteine O-methyltransferase Ste14
LGLVPAALGLALSVVADQAFKRHRTTVKPFEESTALVASGAYAVSRHPMYLGFALLLLCLAVCLGALTPFLVVPLFVVAMEFVFIRTEEQMMEAKFGQSWRDYKKNVRRWL